MKIVYVGDNRHRGNFGCRATSTALSQLISEENEIVGRIYGDFTNSDTGNLFFCRSYPKWVYKIIEKIKNKRHKEMIRQFIYLFHRMKVKGHYYFSKYDFIGYDFDKSIENLIKCLPANPNLKEYDLRQYDFDALVVNGEGSFIFATPPWRECLIEAMLMYWAQKLGKKVYYLNGMLSDDPYTERNMKTIGIVQPIFEKSEVVSVREHYSYKYAQENFKNINLKLYPDALFSWYDMVNDEFEVKNGKYIMGLKGAEDNSFTDFDFTNKYICISASSSVGLATKDENNAINIYSNLVNKTKEKFKDYNVFLVEVCEGDKFLNNVAKKTNTPIISIDTPILSAAKILSKSSLYISGRYHPSIMASLGGTPCVFMSSNSHKTKSVQELLQYENIKEFSVIPDDEEIEKILNLGEQYLNEGEKIREKIKNRCKELSEETKMQKELLRG